MKLDRELLKTLPKVLLHEHLDGVVRPTTAIELARSAHYQQLLTEDPAELARWFFRGANQGSLPKYLEGFAHSYAFDAENRVTQVDGGATAAYVYDANGQRIRKTTAYGSVDFLYDLGGHEITEVSSGGVGSRLQLLHERDNDGLISQSDSIGGYLQSTDTEQQQSHAKRWRNPRRQDEAVLRTHQRGPVVRRQLEVRDPFQPLAHQECAS